MNTKSLQEAGLSNTEAKVYLSMLELGPALAGEITKKSAVNRTNVYDALERLIEKGLVTYVLSANRRVFEPVNPERLQEILKEKSDKQSPEDAKKAVIQAALERAKKKKANIQPKNVDHLTAEQQEKIDEVDKRRAEHASHEDQS